ncbi:MAG: hypothetical protein DI592_14080 [Stenotrophomonas maltophilia]|nr:MAG: hypothetical protein DI592_14080 [Stenotrophomonas maltophilia]
MHACTGSKTKAGSLAGTCPGTDSSTHTRCGADLPRLSTGLLQPRLCDPQIGVGGKGALHKGIERGVVVQPPPSFW